MPTIPKKCSCGGYPTLVETAIGNKESTLLTREPAHFYRVECEKCGRKTQDRRDLALAVKEWNETNRK